MRVIVKIDGEELPCAPSMGAMLRFKEETGKEVNEIDGRSVSELCIYLYCCVASECNREGKPFGLSLIDFAYRVSPDEMAEWEESIKREAEPEGEEEKKDCRHLRPPGSCGRLHRDES